MVVSGGLFALLMRFSVLIRANKVPITTSTVVEDRRSGIDPAVKNELRATAFTRQYPTPEIRSDLATNYHEGLSMLKHVHICYSAE